MDSIQTFLGSPAFGVVGASSNRQKYGNRVLRCYQQNGRSVFAVNPSEQNIEGVECFPSVSALPDSVKAISIITPPAVTEKVVEDAIEKGITNIWMQPGAESPLAMERCRNAGVNLIADGSCILVVLHYHDH